MFGQINHHSRRYQVLPIVHGLNPMEIPIKPQLFMMNSQCFRVKPPFFMLKNPMKPGRWSDFARFFVVPK